MYSEWQYWRSSYAGAPVSVPSLDVGYCRFMSDWLGIDLGLDIREHYHSVQTPWSLCICCQGALPSSYGTFHGLCWWATITLLFPPLLAIPPFMISLCPSICRPFSLICLSSANFGCISTSSDTFSAGAENRYAEVNVGSFLNSYWAHHNPRYPPIISFLLSISYSISWITCSE